MGSPSVSSAIAQPKKKSHAVLYSLITALLVIVVAGGAYWYFHEDEKPQQKPVVTNKVKTQKKAKGVSKETAIEKVVVEEKSENKMISPKAAKKVKDKTIKDGIQQIKGNKNGKKTSPKPDVVIPNTDSDPAINMVRENLAGQK